MKKQLFALLGSLAIVVAAEAEVLTFDGLSGVYPSTADPAVPDGYGNFIWENFYSLDSRDLPYTGYDYGTISPNRVAYNAWSNEASFSRNSPFTLNSGFFTAAWAENLTINVNGYGEQNYSTSFVVNRNSPTNVTFNWSGLSSVQFSSTWIEPDYGFDLGHFALDNLVVDEPLTNVPEPSTLALILAALFGLGFIRRKNRQV